MADCLPWDRVSSRTRVVEDAGEGFSSSRGTLSPGACSSGNAVRGTLSLRRRAGTRLYGRRQWLRGEDICRRGQGIEGGGQQHLHGRRAPGVLRESPTEMSKQLATSRSFAATLGETSSELTCLQIRHRRRPIWRRRHRLLWPPLDGQPLRGLDVRACDRLRMLAPSRTCLWGSSLGTSDVETQGRITSLVTRQPLTLNVDTSPTRLTASWGPPDRQTTNSHGEAVNVRVRVQREREARRHRHRT